MTSLKQKTIHGLFWNFIETFSSQAIGFISTIILARILFPSDFGLIGMTAIITSLSQVFVDSGFSQALIRKQNCTEKDYNTVFILNVSIAITIYFLIFAVSPYVANFFNQDSLINIIRIISISIVINSFGIIHRTLLTKKIDFKNQAIISLIGSIAGFSISIYMALNGYGVWSLVVRSVSSQIFMVLLLWIISKWRPVFLFSKESFRELFGFGSKLLFVYSLSILFKNVYNVLIGKIYNPSILGLYTNADQMSGLPSGTLTTLYNKVAYPVLSNFQNDNEHLKVYIKKIGQPLLIITFSLMLFLISIADSFIPLLFGNKWISSIPYFKILCIAYMAPILHASNQIIMNIKGRSDYFLNTEILKYILFIPVIILGIYFGIYILLIGFAVHYWIGFFVNAAYSKKLIGYGILEQCKDLFSPLILSITVGFVSYISHLYLNVNEYIFNILFQGIIAIITSYIFVRFSGLFHYHELVKDVKSLIFKKA